MFNVGDYVKGTVGAPYNITTEKMTLARVTQTRGISIEIKVLKHDDNSGLGSKFWVDVNHFEITDAPVISKQIKNALEKHNLWLQGKGGERLVWSRFIANLSDADPGCVDLTGAILSGAGLTGADLSGAILSGAGLTGADLSGADLSGADLTGAGLSGAKNMISAINFMEANFERTDAGYIVYKTFGKMYKTPNTWDIKENSIINETVNPNRTDDCGCGINVAPMAWVKSNYKGDIWKCLIEWAWLPGVVVPYNTNGKIRCERVRLLEIVER